MSYDRETPTRVTLSKEEVEFAKSLGMSLSEYAANKIRMKQELKAGDRQRGG